MTATVEAPASGYRMHVGPADALAISVVMSPQQSVLLLLAQAATRLSTGAPPDLLASIRTRLRPQARFAAQSFRKGDCRFLILPAGISANTTIWSS